MSLNIYFLTKIKYHKNQNKQYLYSEIQDLGLFLKAISFNCLEIVSFYNIATIIFLNFLYFNSVCK